MVIPLPNCIRRPWITSSRISSVRRHQLAFTDDFRHHSGSNRLLLACFTWTRLNVPLRAFSLHSELWPITFGQVRSCRYGFSDLLLLYAHVWKGVYFSSYRWGKDLIWVSGVLLLSCFRYRFHRIHFDLRPDVVLSPHSHHQPALGDSLLGSDILVAIWADTVVHSSSLLRVLDFTFDASYPIRHHDHPHLVASS